ncbi:MAG: hypothetical protein ABR915_03335 [Thermoguttaceae bacterium]|jgi:hypothetical protein
MAAAALLAAVALLAAATRAPAAGAKIAWATGPAFQRQLAAPVDIVWKVPLREALVSLSRAERMAILLDRRVDPGQRIEIKLASVPLAEALAKIARNRQLGLSMLGPVAYFGPPEAASRLRTIAVLRQEEIRRLEPAMAARLLHSKSLAWEDFATPRELLGRLAAEAAVEIDGQARVPHDLWPAAELPPMPWTDRVTLVAAEFDLTFDLTDGGRRIQLVGLPEKIALVRSYPAGPNPDALAKRFKAMAPQAEVKISGDKVWVRGRLEDHEQIASPTRPAGEAKKDRSRGY